MPKSQSNAACWVAIMMGLGTAVLAGGQTTSLDRGVRDEHAASLSSLQAGPYYALVIGNNNYRNVAKLSTPINDANEVAQVLGERYGFHVKKLLDADRAQMLTALIDYRRTLPADSNLLIYYAGHGHHDHDADEAYWLPVDAQADNNANWVSADDITRDVRAMPSPPVLIISDSCYSGYLVSPRAANAAINPVERQAFLAKMLGSKSRNLMSSGGDEPVSDSGVPGHSIFAAALLDGLRRIEDARFSATELFDRFVRPEVGGRSDQLPQYSEIRNSGHEYGDFVFSRQPSLEKSAAANGPAPATGNVRVAAAKAGDKTNHGSSTATLSPSPHKLGWVLGHDEHGLPVFARTQDGGDTWTQPQIKWPPGLELDAIVFATSLRGWTVGLSGILHTEDGGQSWQPQVSGTSVARLMGAAFPTPEWGWVVGSEGTIVHTENGGKTWERQPSNTDANLLSVDFATRLAGWAVGIGGTILHTEDGGSNWKHQSSGTNAKLFSVAFVTPRLGWVAGEDGVILHTDDGGATWKPQLSPIKVRLRCVAFANRDSGWIAGEQGLILHTDDGGITWKAQSRRTTEELGSIAVATPSSVWVVGSGGTILHTDDAGLNWQRKNSGTTESLYSIAVR